jgi:ornithine cyclodeaminase/alanine dehydrogenase
MPALFLTEDEVREVLTMRRAIDAVEEAFRQLAEGGAQNVPRSRAHGKGVMLHTLSASADYLGLVGWKAYTTSASGARFHVALYDAAGGAMVALLEADHLGRMRTGAASGVATDHMARRDAQRVGVLGSGRQARTQLEAVCVVRGITQAYVYSPDPEHRERFAEEMEPVCKTEVVPVDRPREAVEDCGIVITATTSSEPLFDGQLIAEGVHLNVVGSNFLHKAEVDAVTVRRSSPIVCDSIDQCRLEAGDFVEALEAGNIHWSQIYELADVVAGRHTGRARQEDVTLFKSVGLGIEDVAVAARVLEIARTERLGRVLPW